jgi:hypothetical protein
MEAAAPIRVADWQEAYGKDKIQATKDLTQHLEDQTRRLLIDTTDDEQDQLLHRLELLQKHDQPLSTAAHYERTQELLGKLKDLAVNQPAVYQELLAQAKDYYTRLKSHGQTERGLSQRNTMLWTPQVLLGWPLWLYGRLNNFLPYEVPRLVARKLSLYEGYLSTVKILTGVFTFPLFYWLQFKIFQWGVGAEYAWWYLLSLPVSGILAWLYARHFQPRWEGFQYRRWAKINAEEAQQLEALREGLLGGIG